MDCISYKDGYKYQLNADYEVDIPITPEADIDTDYIDLDVNGKLTIRKGYAWDGPSGPTVDTKNFMRGSLVHDALYQLMRHGHLSNDTHRDDADELLRTMCKEDGMTSTRAWWVYRGVRWFGSLASNPHNVKQPIHAPDGCPKD